MAVAKPKSEPGINGVTARSSSAALTDSIAMPVVRGLSQSIGAPSGEISTLSLFVLVLVVAPPEQ
jgi:hypothetical protein